MAFYGRRKRDVLYDYSLGMLGGGIPSLVHAVDAATDEEFDVDEFKYRISVEAAVVGSQISFLYLANALQGPKYAMSFHTLHRSIAPAMFQGARFMAPVVLPIVATVAGAYALHSGHQAIAESLPEHEQPGFWQMVGAALGGNVGVGDHGLF